MTGKTKVLERSIWEIDYEKIVFQIREFRPKFLFRSKILDLVKNAPIWLIFCVWKQLMKRLHHTKYEQNRSNFQIFGPGPKILGLRQKWSDFAHIWCDKVFSWVVFTHQIWAQSEHFWQGPKFWTQFIGRYGKSPFQIFDILLEIG